MQFSYFFVNVGTRDFFLIIYIIYITARDVCLSNKKKFISKITQKSNKAKY